MTPEQENELVARWMGKPGDYRTDPALLWELMERLTAQERGWWVFAERLSGAIRGIDKDRRAVFANTLAEAVFAAAVMQAQADTAAQEGK